MCKWLHQGSDIGNKYLETVYGFEVVGDTLTESNEHRAIINGTTKTIEDNTERREEIQ